MYQRPLTFIRQVVSCITYPKLLKTDMYPPDVKKRAQDILDNCSGNSVGAYTMSLGIEMIRRHVAEYIECRDGHKARWQDISLTAGATTGIKTCLELFCNKVDGKPSGIMLPVPQYPLYSATVAEYGLGHIRYYLDEGNNWALEMSELERAYEEGSKTHCVRAIVVINPGNPTGQVLKRSNIEDIIKFAHKKRLFIFADEVYQANVYDKDSKFFSFKKVLSELGPPYNTVELVSFMSISKGYTGECGLRGGWMELCNMDPGVQGHLYKTLSAMLCPATVGQAAVDCVGAMYAFPRIELPAKAIEAAKAEKKAPDVFYAFKLLEETGICVIPGTGFGQCPGSYHFRTTILPQPKILQEMLDIFQSFHKKFTKEYQ
ncbi:hypothetical protein HF086_002498 [Spodoptera exigua]|uniref:alanine transaminase n=1 Tax=Spodoptera exigua TaxID=7107 RepID=A0A922MMY4_SPOEX|nr:hypothetical protein HF086_002498 [Spodoptera exigua]